MWKTHTLFPAFRNNYNPFILPTFHHQICYIYIFFKTCFNDKAFDLRHISYFIDLVYKEIYYLVAFNDYFFLDSIS